MQAAILAIGDELALGQNIDTNSPWVAAQLAERSILTVEQRIVPDDRNAIAAAIRDLASRVNLLIITGGLGPTDDDLTREALGDVLTPNAALVMDEAALNHITQFFHRRSRPMPAMSRKQAMRPAVMQFLHNPNGTAPGLIGEHAACRIVSLPGPPREMQPMFLQHALEGLAISRAEVILTGMVHEFGLGESDAAQRLGDLMIRTRTPLVGITVSEGIVSARLRASAPASEAHEQLRRTLEEIERAWQPYSFGRDGQTLSASAGSLLRQASRVLVTAESCTGGWLGKAIVDVAGSSDYYLGGWVTYSNAMKHSQLRVPKQLIDEHGAVSQPVAQAMAEGELAISSADESLAITGIAGPPQPDAPSEKPVGTVYICLARRRDNSVQAITRRFLFPGDRSAVRDRSVKAALQMLRFALLDQPADMPLLWEAPKSSTRQSVAEKAAAR